MTQQSLYKRTNQPQHASSPEASAAWSLSASLWPFSLWLCKYCHFYICLSYKPGPLMMLWGSLNYFLYQHQLRHQPFRLPLFATYRPRQPWEHALAGRGGLSALMAWTWRASYSHHRLTKRWCLLIAQTRGMEGSYFTGSPQHLFQHQPRSQLHWPCQVFSVLTVVPYSGAVQFCSFSFCLTGISIFNHNTCY